MTRLVPPAPVSTPALAALRREVRDFVAGSRRNGGWAPSVDSWLVGWDEDFTRALAARGWVGMTVPVEYGGHGRSHVERFVVTEELLAAGAPVAAHWIADRQIVPSLLKYGTELQKRTYLSAIVRGECFFAIGMSEPDSGSDLAGIRTTATQVDDGWQVTGTKLWTSGAHRAHAFICLARTAPRDPADRHGGLSQFIVDLRSPDVQVSPVVSMDGRHHFNEVALQGVVVPDEMVFGSLGGGWQQVTSELGFERSGPERCLSTFPLLAETVERMHAGAAPRDAEAGRLVGRLIGLHHLSLSVADALERGAAADVAAASVKVLGTSTEGDIVDVVDLLTDPTESDADHLALLEQARVQRPGFTLRGGTNEVLRGVIARGLGMR